MTAIDKLLITIQEAIEIEKFGYTFYTNMRSFVKDRDGHKFISYLANLEVEHIKWLEDQYKKQLKKLESFDESKTVDISIIGKDEIFITDNMPQIFKEFDKIKALDFAIGIEKRSVEFYKKNMDIIEDDELKQLFKRLVDFESEHIEILSEAKKNLQTTNNWLSIGMHFHW